ncbi:MAG: ABC transporter substrate-binding protein [Candidatus Limnocylindrales bacterium]
MALPETPGSPIDGLASRTVTRRSILKGIAGVAGVASIPALIAACSSSATPSPSASSAPSAAAPSAAPPSAAAGSAATGTVSVGSNHSDAGEAKGMAAIDAAFTAATGIAVTLNTVDHNTFQNQITSYLGGTPEDDFTWFSGYRMRFFAAQGLTTAIDDVWAKVSSNFTSAFATSVTGTDGKVYGIPVDYYPWAVFYRKSVFAAKGYTIPATWTDLKTLCAKMKSDGLIPIAFGDKDGWPAMGTFDILDLRLNGYQFHVDLLTGKQKWTDPKVTTVFQKWTEILPYQDTTFAGLTWQQAADTLVQKKSGMYLLGLFMTSEFAATGNPADLADVDFFPYPTLGTQYDSEKALDAPIDIWMMSAKSPTLQADLDAAKAYLEFWSKGSTQLIMFQNQPGFIPTASDTDTSSYSALQKKAQEIVSSAQKITQFLDRDSRPDFAGPNGMQGFLLKFLQKPTQDLPTLQGQIQAFWDSLPPAS